MYLRYKQIVEFGILLSNAQVNRQKLAVLNFNINFLLGNRRRSLLGEWEIWKT